MKTIGLMFALAGLSLAADAPKTFTGTVGDDMCKGDHATMQGTDPVKCTHECVKQMGARYALWVDSNVYILSDQKAAEKFAGKKVTVTGDLTDKKIAVKSIRAAK